ncbi:MAG: NosD domain-containing protein [Candidatus Hodarchaeota archaeon]
MENRSKKKVLERAVIGIFFGIGFALLSVLPDGLVGRVDDAPGFQPGGLKASIPSPVIDINSNGALAGFVNNTGGNGTSWADAVIIEDLQIIAYPGQNCITIQSTDLYLVIRNCTLTIADGLRGIHLDKCMNVNITGNDVSGTGLSLHGIQLYQSENNTISWNDLSGNGNDGILLVESSNNTILGNNITYNMGNGIRVVSLSNNNTMYGNALSGNAGGNADDSCSNAWDDGMNGNYWGDYVASYSNVTHDGVTWNTSYSIPGGSMQDNFPLVKPFVLDTSPVADFFSHSTSILEGGLVQFGFIGDLGNGIASYEWDFGDESTNSTVAGPVHRYTTAGTYTVTLTVVDFDGDASSCFRVIQVNEGGDGQPSGLDANFILIVAIGAVAGVALLGNVLLVLKLRKLKGRSLDKVVKKGK